MQSVSKKGGTGIQYNNMFKGIYVIFTNEGMGGLYKGIRATWIREAVYSPVRLGLYEPIKAAFGASSKTAPFYKKFAAGATAGFFASIVANPLDLLKIRMQAQETTNHPVSWHIKDIYKNKGIQGFYAGLQATVMRAMVINATKLSVYDQIKNQLISKKIATDGMPLHFLSSFSAGLCMALSAAPLDICKTRLMNQPKEAPLYTGLADCMMKTFRNEGFLGLYNGVFPMWMRFGPYTVIQLMTWELLRKFTGMDGI